MANPSRKRSQDIKGEVDKPERTGKERLAWGVITEEEIGRPGAPLLMLIFQAAFIRNLQASDVCTLLGITPGHLSALRSGNRSFSNISEEFADRIAEFLGITKVAVKLAAGQLRLEDFFYQGNQVNDQIDAALRFILSDPIYGPKMPATIFTAQRELKIFCITLYEDATGKVVLRGKVDPKDVVQRFESLTKAMDPPAGGARNV